MAWVGWLMIAAGLIMFGVVTYRWNWVKKSYRARLLIKAFNESGAKIAYTISSVIIIVFGILFATGVWG